jgi:hypothetical protein
MAYRKFKIAVPKIDIALGIYFCGTIKNPEVLGQDFFRYLAKNSKSICNKY